MKHAIALILAISLAAQSPAPYLSFVTCPIVRDTKTQPCWLAEYRGETYFLGVQGGVVNDFYPPQLNHQVLVEGSVAPGPRVCGGIPLKPLKTSVLLEIDRACNQILPAEDGLDAPARPPAGNPESWLRSAAPGQAELYFDFDNDFLSLHTTGALQRAAEFFLQSRASALEVTAYRGSSKLSDGRVLVEQPNIADLRASKIAAILAGLGVPPASIKTKLVTAQRKPVGPGDAHSRRVVVEVKP